MASSNKMKTAIKTILVVMAIVATTKITIAQTPYDDFAPSHKKKKMLKLPEATFKAINSDTTSKIKFIELDNESLVLKYFGKDSLLIAQTQLQPNNFKWLSVDPLTGKHADYTPYGFCANNPIRYIDPDGRDWVDGNGNAFSDKALGKVQIYIFHDNDFAEQAMVQYKTAVAKYGAGAVALSNTGTTAGFSTDWGNMQGKINQVMIMTHGKNQSIKVGEGQQFTATGDGKTNITGTPAPNIQDLPQPQGNIENATLSMYSCHAADQEKKAHGEGDHAQGDLKGTGKNIANVFSETFRFGKVYGTQGAVNYNSFWTNGTSTSSSIYMQPYPENGHWLYYTPPVIPTTPAIK